MKKLIKPEDKNSESDISNIDFSQEDLKTKVSVKPLKKGGTNFKTHVLSNDSELILSYKPSYGTAIFCWLFLSIGLGLCFFGVRSLALSSGAINFSSFLLIGIGLIFSLTGLLMFYNFYKPIVFDKKFNTYRNGYSKKNQSQIKTQGIPLKDIIAIQIIGEQVQGDKSTFNSFELNLVLNTGERKNIIDHGNLDSIISDAQAISDFLQIPIWHAKSGSN